MPSGRVEFARRFLGLPRPDAAARGSGSTGRFPPTAGSGSGTQLGLAVARALAELHGLARRARGAGPGGGPGRAVGHRHLDIRPGRLHRGGGTAGRRSDEIAPLLARSADSRAAGGAWSPCPPGAPGLSGEAEAAAFERLPPPPEREVERVAHLVLMQLLPGAGRSTTCRSFGAALTDGAADHGGLVRPAAGRHLRPGPLGDAGAPGWRSGAPRGWDRAPGDRRCTGWWRAKRRAGRWRPACAELLGSGGRVFEGGFAGSGRPGLAGGTGRDP